LETKTNPRRMAGEPGPKKRPPGVLLFVPGPLNHTEVIQWLKRVHGWTGFWGALAFLAIGTSGLMLNHRATLKIETGAPVEVNEANIVVDPALIKSPDDLGRWAQRQFGTALEPRTPRAEGGGGGPRRGGGGDGARREGGERAQLMGQDVAVAPVWKQSFTGANGVLSVEYSPGSTFVKASKSEQNVWGLLKNLHKGVGMSWVWVLFIDTMAGGLIAMSLTGALLWSRLHGPRLAAVGIVMASLGLALFAAWPGLI
jgi:uncharacterized protein